MEVTFYIAFSLNNSSSPGTEILSFSPQGGERLDKVQRYCLQSVIIHQNFVVLKQPLFLYYRSKRHRFRIFSSVQKILNSGKGDWLCENSLYVSSVLVLRCFPNRLRYVLVSYKQFRLRQTKMRLLYILESEARQMKKKKLSLKATDYFGVSVVSNLNKSLLPEI